MNGFYLVKSLSAVGRLIEPDSQGIDGILIVGIHPDLSKNPTIGGRMGTHEFGCFFSLAACLRPIISCVGGLENDSPFEHIFHGTAVVVQFSFFCPVSYFIAIHQKV